MIKESNSRNELARLHTSTGAMATAAAALGADDSSQLGQENKPIKRRLHSGMNLGGGGSPMSLVEKQSPVLGKEGSSQQARFVSAKDIKS